MIHSWVDLSVIVSENRRVTHGGLTGFEWYRYRSEQNPTGYNSTTSVRFSNIVQLKNI